MITASRSAEALDVFAISARTQIGQIRSSPFVIVLGFVQPVALLLVNLLPRAEAKSDDHAVTWWFA